MSWTKADGDAHSDLAHTLFLSSKTIADTFPVVARADEVTSWRDAVFEVVASVELSHSVMLVRSCLWVRYVATGETDPETAVELLGCALAKCGYPEDATEAVVDAIWSHDVSTPRRSSHALLTFSRAGADRIT